MISYQMLLRHILNHGDHHSDRTGVGTLSVFGYQWRHYMCTGFPLLTTKRVGLRWVAEELRWFLAGSTNVGELQKHGVDIWKEWATTEQCIKFGRDAGDLGPIYGSMWRSFPVGDSIDDSETVGDFNVDQITELVHDIQSNPQSRRLIVSAWHPYYQRRVTLPPCHTLWQVKCHGTDGLSLHLYARSIDAFLGLPFNIASYGLLLEILARATKRFPRELIISFGDLHIYKNHLQQVELQLSRQPKRLPVLNWKELTSFGGGINAVLNWEYDDVELTGYDPHPKIEAPIAI